MDLEKLSKQIQKPVLPEEDILQKFNDIIQILSAVESKGDKLRSKVKLCKTLLYQSTKNMNKHYLK